jgi:hypothetical protein
MAAGLGFKDFTTGEVLTAADVDGYLMQGVWVFASAAARDAAVTSPQEGNFAYLKDTNVTTYYTGSAWANLDTTGMTNPMTTTGDTIYSSSGSTPARLGIGSTGQVLTVAGGVPSWATPTTPSAGANWTLLNSGGTNLSGTTTTVSGISGKDKILVIVSQASTTAGLSQVGIRLNSDTGSNYFYYGGIVTATGTSSDILKDFGTAYSRIQLFLQSNNAASAGSGSAIFTGCNASGVKVFTSMGGATSSSSSTGHEGYFVNGYYDSSSSITSVNIFGESTFDAGKVFVYTSD